MSRWTLSEIVQRNATPFPLHHILVSNGVRASVVSWIGGVMEIPTSTMECDLTQAFSLAYQIELLLLWENGGG